MSASTLYREHILDHYKNPRNYGRMGHATVSSKGSNPLCGDEIEIFLKIDKKGKITDVKFLGKGCAISQASASLLTEDVKGIGIRKAESISSKEILGLLHIEVGPVRLKCALLPLEALKGGLSQYKGKH